MARFSNDYPSPENEITVLQQTIEDLRNNTLTHAYYDMLCKIMNEGYRLIFKGLEGDEDITIIKDTSHLKNYINCIQGVKIIS
jgi:hypothetical protein